MDRPVLQQSPSLSLRGTLNLQTLVASRINRKSWRMMLRRNEQLREEAIVPGRPAACIRQRLEIRGGGPVGPCILPAVDFATVMDIKDAAGHHARREYDRAHG